MSDKYYQTIDKQDGVELQAIIGCWLKLVVGFRVVVGNDVFEYDSFDEAIQQYRQVRNITAK